MIVIYGFIDKSLYILLILYVKQCVKSIIRNTYKVVNHLAPSIFNLAALLFFINVS